MDIRGDPSGLKWLIMLFTKWVKIFHLLFGVQTQGGGIREIQEETGAQSMCKENLFVKAYRRKAARRLRIGLEFEPESESECFYMTDEMDAP